MSFIKLTDLDLAGKRVLIRADLNVPVKEGKVTSDARISASMPTIEHCLKAGARVMVMSHRGRPEEGVADEENSMQPIAEDMAAKLGRDVRLIKDYLENAPEVAEGEVVLFENVRFNAGEKKDNEELARAAKAKDLFLATMSHELRTPLTTVLGLTEMLKDRLYGPLNDAQEKSLSTVEESSRHLLTLINDILDVAKVESGKMELKWDYIPVAQLVEASLRLVRQPAQKKSLQLESSIDPAISLIHGDSRRLKQVLVNLLGNAVKFTPAGGRIGLDVTLGENRKSVHLSVWDTGIGIEEGHQARLFEPFVQLDNEPTRRYSGTGLGLTLVNRLAQLHGGAIEVESHPGQGSRFTFSLPWKKARNLPEKVEIRGGTLDNDDTPPENLGRIHILLAEDNVANRGMISEFLRHQGLSVSVALDGPDVIRQATGGNPDIILMDIQLKELNGFEVTRELRRHPRLAQTPIIALTALAMPGDRERCLEAGMDDYLSKPMGLKELYRRILDFITDR
ncbi:MAG: phosphoglycerate kinase [Candidatus Sedimenticola endophacoides]|nr:MAG: phosphoglycerate kinase [Candidatus Sedimenticola endophacoides]